MYTTALAARALAYAENPPVTDPNTPPPSQLGQIRGQVIDGETGQPLSGVLVSLTTTETATYSSDIDGNFLIEDISPAEYAIALSLAGYRTVSATTTINDGQVIDFGVVQMLRSVDAVDAIIRGNHY